MEGVYPLPQNKFFFNDSQWGHFMHYVATVNRTCGSVSKRKTLSIKEAGDVNKLAGKKEISFPKAWHLCVYFCFDVAALAALVYTVQCGVLCFLCYPVVCVTVFFGISAISLPVVVIL